VESRRRLERALEKNESTRVRNEKGARQRNEPLSEASRKMESLGEERGKKPHTQTNLIRARRESAGGREPRMRFQKR